MNPDGPYVSVAAVCESVLHEKDGRVSCIRLFDVLNVNAHQQEPDRRVAIRLQVNAFVAFKAGSFIGTKNCMLRLITPSGKPGKLSEGAPKSYPMVFNGGHSGHNLIVTLDIPATESGLYWFDVTLDDEIHTRIPLQINITWQNSPSQVDSENSQHESDQP